MGLFTSTIDRLAGFFGYVRPSDPAREQSVGGRLGTYAVNAHLYDGTIYVPRAKGGALEDVLHGYFNRTDAKGVRMAGNFLPFREIVDAYLNVFPGVWGQTGGMGLAREFNGKPVNPKLAEPLTRLWRDSNLDTEKNRLQHLAANLGTVGVRAVAVRRTEQGGPDWSVTLRATSPADITSVEEDDLGNVVAVGLRYQRPYNAGTLTEPDIQIVEVVETITKDEFSQKVDDQEQLDDADRRNAYGFCPFVLLRHKDNGTLYGDWAYRGIEQVVHHVNYRIGRQDVSIDRHQFPKWFATAGGAKPTTIDMGSDQIAYVPTVAGTPPPSLAPLVAQINQAAAQAFWMELRDMLRGPQPELTINDVRLLSGVSGETIAQILKPAESAILKVRPAYDHALVRALQMGLSMGADLGLWDVGAGTGPGAGDRSYQAGLEAFEFQPRPAIPQTTYQQVQQAKAETERRRLDYSDAKLAQGIGVDNEEVLRIAGYDPKQVRDILDRKRTNDVVPEPDEEL